jgi:hypothetical protein
LYKIVTNYDDDDDGGGDKSVLYLLTSLLSRPEASYKACMSKGRKQDKQITDKARQLII